MGKCNALLKLINLDGCLAPNAHCGHYGIPGCGVFKGGNKKGFWLKINCIQMKLPNFENWSNGELSKSTEI